MNIHHVETPEKGIQYRLIMIKYEDGSDDWVRLPKSDKTVRYILEYDELDRKGHLTFEYKTKNLLINETNSSKEIKEHDA